MIFCKKMNFIDCPDVHVVVEGAEQIKLPKMMKIKQMYDRSKIENISSWIREQMKTNIADQDRYEGKRICITAGSRGIPHLDLIIRTVVDELKDWGARPFIIPAMGSHGGATAQGQLELLSTYNITEQ